MAYTINDFSDIYTRVMEALKVQSGDTTSKNRIKRIINEVYLQEVVPFKRWYWLRSQTHVEHKAAYTSGTASVTPNSTTVTLSVAPLEATGSRANYYFAVDGYNEVYPISAHTAGSTTVTLATPYTGTLDTAANFKIWTDRVALPTTCAETFEVWHDHAQQHMKGMGYQDFKSEVAKDPRFEDRPAIYSTHDYFDPTSGTGETESDRYRLMLIYPAVYTQSTTIHIDYLVEPEALDADGDEPLLPKSDRVVLFYGAMSRAASEIARNEELAQKYEMYFQQKLGRMAGKVEDGIDTPKVTPDGRYLSSKRGPRIRGARRFATGSGGGGGNTTISYAQNITIEGGNITDDITVSSGVTFDGRDVSADGSALDSHLAATAAHGATGAVVGTTNTQTLTNKTIDVDDNTIIGVPADVQTELDAIETDLAAHTGNTSNPHSVTKAQVGLSNVDNTSDATKNAAAVTLTNKTIDADSNTITNIENADIKAAAAIALSKLAATTADRALVSDGSGFVSPATTTATEIGYVNGVTSSIQTQLDAKQLRSTLTAKGDLYVATASNTVARQAVGTDGFVLTADSAQTNGIKWAAVGTKVVQSKTTTYTALTTDDVILASTSGGAWTLTLPTASGNSGKVFSIKKTTTDTNALTIDGNGAETIDGDTTLKLYYKDDYVEIVSDGTNWQSISRKQTIAMRAIRGTSDQTITTFAGIIYNTAQTDTAAMLNTSTGVVTVPQAGIYLISGNAKFDGLTSGGNASIDIAKNGSSINQIYTSVLDATTTSHSVQWSQLIRCAASDTLSIIANGDASFTVDSSVGRNCLSVMWVGN